MKVQRTWSLSKELYHKSVMFGLHLMIMHKNKMNECTTIHDHQDGDSVYEGATGCKRTLVARAKWIAGGRR